jgi:hypothetical protein
MTAQEAKASTVVWMDIEEASVKDRTGPPAAKMPMCRSGPVCADAYRAGRGRSRARHAGRPSVAAELGPCLFAAGCAAPAWLTTRSTVLQKRSISAGEPMVMRERVGQIGQERPIAMPLASNPALIGAAGLPQSTISMLAALAARSARAG